MKKHLVSALVLIFVSAFSLVTAASGQSCPKVAFPFEPGEKIAPDDWIPADFEGRKKVALDEFAYSWTASAGKIKHESPNVYYIYIDTMGIAEGTRIDIQVTAVRGSCRSTASTWFVTRPSKSAVKETPKPVVAVPAATPVALPTPAACPKVTVAARDSVDAGDTLMFVAVLKDFDTKQMPTFSWSVSGGSILTGQGTAAIKMDTSNFGGQVITATVNALGPYGCSGSYSATTIVNGKVVEGRKFDEFPYLGPKKNEFLRLDDLILTLKSEPTAKAYFILYLGRKGLPGAIKAWSAQTSNYLIRKGIAKARITTVDGGYRDNGTLEAWILPPGAADPYPTPTVDPSEIVQPKTPTKPRRRP